MMCASKIASQLKETVTKEDTIHLWVLFIILLLGIVIRLIFLFQPMRYDEAFSFIHFASKPLSLGLSDYSFPNNHLFHTFLVHLAYSTLGNQPWIIRLPAVLAGIFLVPASYIATRIFYHKDAALLTAGLVASSSILIEYSTNARGYTLICLIFLVELTFGAFLMQRVDLSPWVLFSAISATGFYTIPIMLYPFGIVIVWLFLTILFEKSERDRAVLLQRLGISIAITALLALLLYLPVFLSSGLTAIIGNRFVRPRAWAEFFSQFPGSLLSIWQQWNRDIPFAISLFLVFGFFASLLFHRRVCAYRVPVVAAALLWVLPVITIQRVIPFERVWLFFLPLYLGLASAGLSYLFGASRFSARSIVFMMGILVLTIWLGLSVVGSRSVYYSNETGTLRDAEAITIFLKGYLKSGDRVIAAVPSDAPLVYYFNLHEIPLKYFTGDLVSNKRIMVVINESYHQTLKWFLDRIKREEVGFNTPEVILRYESATLYQIVRPDGKR